MGLKKFLAKHLLGRDEHSSQATLSEGDRCAQQGWAALDANDYHLAVEQFERAVQLHLTKYDAAEIYTGLGKAYNRLDQFEQAIAAHQQALAINPTYHKAWNNLGIAYYYLGKLDEAEKCHKQALECEPDYAYAQASLGAVCIDRNKPEQAVAWLTEAISRNPRISVAYGNLALAYGMLGQFVQAEDTLKHAVTLGYNNWETVRKRLERLKRMTTDAGSERQAERKDWLPSHCPACGAPVSVATVEWTSAITADCSYCGVNLRSR